MTRRRANSVADALRRLGATPVSHVPQSDCAYLLGGSHYGLGANGRISITPTQTLRAAEKLEHETRAELIQADDREDRFAGRPSIRRLTSSRHIGGT